MNPTTTTQPPLLVAEDDPLLRQVMATVTEVTADGRVDPVAVLDTVYRHVIAYQRTRDARLLTDLARSLMVGWVLWASEQYWQGLREYRRIKADHAAQTRPDDAANGGGPR